MDILSNFYNELNKKHDEDRALAIGVLRNGESISEGLDYTSYNHAVIFDYIASKLELPISNSMNPLEAAINLANFGVLTIQVRNGICIIYFPSDITNNQYEYLKNFLENNDYLYQFLGSNQEEGYLDKITVIDYANSIKLREK